MDLSRVSSGIMALKAENPASKAEVSDPESLRRACQEFESIFLTYLLKTMRNTVPNTEHSLSGSDKNIYLSMMDQELARAVSKGPGVGLATAIYRQLSQVKKL